MPKNGFIMRFFGCVQLPVGVVGAERSIQLSHIYENRPKTDFSYSVISGQIVVRLP